MHQRMFITTSIFDDDDEKERTKQNLSVRSGKSVAEVTDSRRLRSNRRFVLLKLTTDRHEASRGLFATAELLVFYFEAKRRRGARHVLCTPKD